jgi:lipid-binding SYLF domain-containing protein
MTDRTRRDDMRKCTRGLVAIVAVAISTISLTAPRAALAAAAAGVDEDANAALKKLYASEPAAKLLSEKAKAILVFPTIVKAGFLVGAHYGEGVLIQNGRTVGHYNSLAGSYGYQAGVQTYGYALFLMNDQALQYLDRSDGWEIGVGPSVVVVDKGKGKSVTSTTLTKDVYAFIFNQKGLMAGAGIQGSKITKVSQ